VRKVLLTELKKQSHTLKRMGREKEGEERESFESRQKCNFKVS
jgi:hypothetical protein